MIRCSDCGAELQLWETVYSWDCDHRPEWLCEDCFEGKRMELSNAEFARLIGSEVCKAEDLENLN